MKKFFEKISGAVWLQVIAVSCVLFFVNIAAGASLERVDSASKQLSGKPGQSESSDSLDLSGQSINESGAFGDWESFSDFYEESQSARPDSSSSRESSSEPSSTSSSEPSSSQSSSSESHSEPSIDVAPSEPSSQESSTPSSESSSEPSSEPTSQPATSDSPMDAPSHETAPPIPSENSEAPVSPVQ